MAVDAMQRDSIGYDTMIAKLQNTGIATCTTNGGLATLPTPLDHPLAQESIKVKDGWYKTRHLC